jgi:hypothetical protein
VQDRVKDAKKILEEAEQLKAIIAKETKKK